MALTGQLADPNYRYSINEFTGTGLQVNWEINFAGGYIDRSHVKAVVKDSLGNVTERDLAWAGDSTVVIYPPVGEGLQLTIYRETPKDAPLADFVDNAVINEVNLDRNARQAVMIAAEALDRGEGALGELSPRAILVPVGEIAPQWPIPAALRGKYVAVDFDGRIVGKNFLGGDGPLDSDMVLHEGQSVHDWLTSMVGDIGDLANAATSTGEQLIEQALRDDELDSRLADLRTDHESLVGVVDAITDFVEGGDGLATIIVNERAERQAEDAAMAATIGMIGAKTPDGTAFMIDIDQVLVEDGVTMADRFSHLEAETDTLETRVEDEEGARIAGDVAEANARNTLAATLRGETASAVEIERLARIDSVTAEASSRESLAATLRGEATAATDAEREARVAGDAAEASSRATLAATLRDEAAALATSLTTAQVDGDSALASTLAILGAENGDGSAFTLDTSRVLLTGGTALGTRLSGIDTSVGTVSSSLASEVTTRSTQNAAMVADIGTLNVTLGGFSSTVTTLATVQADHSGYITSLQARYGVTLDVDGYISGFSLNNSGTSSDFIVRAGKFAIGAPGASTAYPFEVVGGVTYIKSAMIQSASIETAHIKDLAVDSLKLAGQAVTTEKIAPNNITVRYLNVLAYTTTISSGMTNLFSRTITKVSASSNVAIRLDVRFSSADDLDGYMYIYRDGSLIDFYNPKIIGATNNSLTRLLQSLSTVDMGVGAGPVVYSAYVQDTSGAFVQALAGSSLSIEEILV